MHRRHLSWSKRPSFRDSRISNLVFIYTIFSLTHSSFHDIYLISERVLCKDNSLFFTLYSIYTCDTAMTQTMKNSTSNYPLNSIVGIITSFCIITMIRYFEINIKTSTALHRGMSNFQLFDSNEKKEIINTCFFHFVCFLCSIFRYHQAKMTPSLL